MKYPNVLGVLGLNIREGRIRNEKELINFIKDKKLFNIKLERWEDPDGDYIWCIFYKEKLEDYAENIVDYILMEDQERLW